MLKKFKFKKDMLSILLILAVSLPTYFNLFKPGYFSMHDDIQVIRQYEMEKCFLDGQLPCRWAPQMGLDYGQPMFNYYSVFPYYFGEVFRLFGFSFIGTIKILFLLSLLLSGIFMYFFSKEFFGRFGGILSAILFLYGPYHAVDVYVRGALSENWGIAFFPIIFLSVYKLIKEEKVTWFLLTIISYCGLFLSHNIMSLIFTPFAITWGFYWIVSLKKTRSTFKFLLSLLWSLGLSAFYVIPAFLEKKLINTEWLITNYYNFQNHFANKFQLFFSRFWGYGASAGINSQMSFQIGWPHWWIVGFVALVLLYSIIRKQNIKPVKPLIYFILLFVISVLFTHQKSLFIWNLIPVLSFVQFPWRFLGLVIFSASFISGSIFPLLANHKIENLNKYILSILIIITVILNWSFFKPEKYFPKMNDNIKLSGIELKRAESSAVLDYLPTTVKLIPKEIAPELPVVEEGKARVSEYKKRSNFWRFSIDVSENSPAKIKVPIFDFPNWQILIDQKQISYSSDEDGMIVINVSPGKHTVVGWFKNTPVRDIANAVSLVSFGMIILYIFYKDFKDEELA